MKFNFKAILHNLLDDAMNLNSILTKVIIAIATFFAPVQLYLITILVMTLLDVITGVWSAKKSGKEFKSRILRSGLLEKLIIYGLLMIMAIVFGMLLQSVFHYKTFYIAWILTILISTYEISSIIENIIVINPNLAFLNKLKALVNAIGDKQIEDATKKLTVDIDDKDIKDNTDNKNKES